MNPIYSKIFGSQTAKIRQIITSVFKKMRNPWSYQHIHCNFSVIWYKQPKWLEYMPEFPLSHTFHSEILKILFVSCVCWLELKRFTAEVLAFYGQWLKRNWSVLWCYPITQDVLTAVFIWDFKSRLQQAINRARHWALGLNLSPFSVGYRANSS